MSYGNFWVIFLGSKMGTPKTIRAFMYLPKSGRVKEDIRGRDKKTDRDKDRAHDCPKRHANYGLSSPVSIPTLGESLAQFYVAQFAQIKRIYYFLFGRHLAQCLVAQGRHIELKGKARVWRTFFYYMRYAQIPLFRA